MGIKISPSNLISRGLNFFSPLLRVTQRIFSDYKDKEYFCNRQRKMRLFLHGEKKNKENIDRKVKSIKTNTFYQLKVRIIVLLLLPLCCQTITIYNK